MDNGRHIKAVILDWAGTVVDFGCFAPMHAFLKTFEQAGVPITNEEAREPMGLLKWDHIEAILRKERVKREWEFKYGETPVKEDVDRLYAGFEMTLMESLKNFTDPIPGALETVARLREAGLKIGSTTGYTKKMMDVIVPEARRKGYAPDYMVTSDEVKAGRPYPYMIFKNMTELGVYPPESIVKVGDTVSDIHEGKNAGVWTIAVIMGSSELGLTLAEAAVMDEGELMERMKRVRQTFGKAGADFIIDYIAELPEEIELLERNGLVRGLK
ncbi:phosphonoacetaldehyde hydrolase [Paenibacillus luteus]|uniref:phosphonoacetaldehyde hydrolase n=1 Tax=Paenibacillus luteus TaxID=2545753 RepID=UPI001143B439|nr:phosphonoacetaldehyde hydrolase [Paenibacillus luteus]